MNMARTWDCFARIHPWGFAGIRSRPCLEDFFHGARDSWNLLMMEIDIHGMLKITNLE